MVAQAADADARQGTATTDSTETRGERITAAVLITFTLLFAFIVQSLFFHTWSNMHGDIAYHRWVGLEMLGVDLQGEGPFRHLLAYYGGL